MNSNYSGFLRSFRASLCALARLSSSGFGTDRTRLTSFRKRSASRLLATGVICIVMFSVVAKGQSLANEDGKRRPVGTSKYIFVGQFASYDHLLLSRLPVVYLSLSELRVFTTVQTKHISVHNIFSIWSQDSQTGVGLQLLVSTELWCRSLRNILGIDDHREFLRKCSTAILSGNSNFERTISGRRSSDICQTNPCSLVEVTHLLGRCGSFSCSASRFLHLVQLVGVNNKRRDTSWYQDGIDPHLPPLCVFPHRQFLAVVCVIASWLSICSATGRRRLYAVLIWLACAVGIAVLGAHLFVQ